MMNKIKYLVFAIAIALLSIYLYQNFIYYQIPFNPIKEYVSESMVDFHITQNLPNGESVSVKCHEPDTCDLVLEYLSDLKLIPLKDKKAQKMISDKEHDTYLTGVLKFTESEEIFIKDIYIDDPTVLYISSANSGFKREGYYKIVDSTFDYNYIFELISKTEE
ncbi:hypothetical protein [Psychrobacillus sp. NPDC096389]|uniref:hypothetical protein n=1 Tax=Psychrobacillus sp. NPDC096389 TaxID=3364490 RepID=UPI0038157084